MTSKAHRLASSIPPCIPLRLLLKLSRVGPGQFLDGRPDAAGSGVREPVGGTFSSGLKFFLYPSDWGHCPV